MEANDINLLPDQEQVMKALVDFCKDEDSRMFVLSGYAGTGKTTLLRKFISWLVDQGYCNGAEIPRTERGGDIRQFVSLASTGRAAKVLSDKTGSIATTVHGWIYHFNGFNQDIAKMVETIEKNQHVDNTGQLLLDFGFSPLDARANHVIYIVDESSMISDVEDKHSTQAVFGSGRLLHDLINYDPTGKFVFVGDDCQLPPVNGTGSPALDEQYIKNEYHLQIHSATLTQIVRQDSDNDIIVAAGKMRELCMNPPRVKWGQFPMKGYRHIGVFNTQQELVDKYVEELKQNGYDATTLLTGSNNRCTSLSSQIRKRLGFTDPRVMPGELLLVTQNNLPTRLMNGDLVKVRSIGNRVEKAHLVFLDVEVEELVTKKVYRTLLIESLLYSTKVNLTEYEQKGLFIDFYYREREKGIKQKDAEYKQDIMQDQYLNALRAVYGYAITCHKAQGGEWPAVYLDIPRYLSHEPDRSAYQWLYTAMTRASDMLYIINDYFIV